MPLTVSECRLQQYSLTAWCEPCRRGVELDLLPLLLRNEGLELPDLLIRLRCDRCGRPASELVVSRMRIGKVEDVVRYTR